MTDHPGPDDKMVSVESSPEIVVTAVRANRATRRRLKARKGLDVGRGKHSRGRKGKRKRKGKP